MTKSPKNGNHFYREIQYIWACLFLKGALRRDDTGKRRFTTINTGILMLTMYLFLSCNSLHIYVNLNIKLLFLNDLHFSALSR